MHFNNHPLQTEDDIDKFIKQHFVLESLRVQAQLPKNSEDHQALEILEQTSRRLSDERFKTGLLWKKKNKVKLPSNYLSALTKLYNLKRKLDKYENLKMKYEEQIQNLINIVVNPSKTKILIVHNAAAHGVCLNDHLLPGPDLLQLLPGVLMRFRQRPVAVNANIKEMFLQRSRGRQPIWRTLPRPLWRAATVNVVERERKVKAVIKNFSLEIDAEEIKPDLKRQGYPVRYIECTAEMEPP
ncbi:hypothetical protein EVAR_82698_1 [Eumeta japonica]|uniref:Uncharacterized protein n=1 Tax=Eumeta variegata TaxID=151549 RepID=A0A4C1VAS9_EUMVA|nr:hypothetical protein EVAR_82698_1 [Eumeta japonica]